MNARKILSIVLVVMLALALLVACGPADEPDPDPVDDDDPVDENGEPEPLEDVEIDIVVGFAAGGSNDLSARYLSEKLRDHGIIANVVNMPGSMGTEAAYHVSTQSPDANMFMWAHAMIMLFEPAAGDRGFTIHDFEPVALIASPTFAIASRAGAPWEDMDDLIQYIKDNPGEVVLGGQGEDNLMHFISELILDPDELDYTYVGLAGGADVATNLIGGHVDLGHLSLAAARPLHEEGDLTVLINTQILIDRDPLMPDIPNVIEFGIEGREPHPLALWGPIGTSPELKERISAAMAEIQNDPEFVQNYQDIGIVAHYLDAEETWDFFMDFEESLVPRYVEWLDARF